MLLEQRWVPVCCGYLMGVTTSTVRWSSFLNYLLFSIMFTVLTNDKSEVAPVLSHH